MSPDMHSGRSCAGTARKMGEGVRLLLTWDSSSESGHTSQSPGAGACKAQWKARRGRIPGEKQLLNTEKKFPEWGLANVYSQKALEPGLTASHHNL